MLFSLAVIALLAALPLLVMGARVRRVGDHPHCRRCEFDLFGLTSESSRCPECGATLAAGVPVGSWGPDDWDPAAVAVGLRTRRTRLLAWGLALGLPSAAWLGLFALAALGGADAYRHKPEALLAWETRAGGLVSRRAVAELCRRAASGTLSPQREQALAAAFLDDQADLAKPWTPEKGDFLVVVARAGRLVPADWERYVFQAFAPALEVRPLVSFEGPVPYRVDPGKLRLATALPKGNTAARTSTPTVTLSVVAEYADGSVYAMGHSRLDVPRSDIHETLRYPKWQFPPAIPFRGSALPVPGGAAVARRYGIMVEEDQRAMPPPIRALPAWPAHVLPLAVAPPGEPTAVARHDPQMPDLARRTLYLSASDVAAWWRKGVGRPGNTIGVRPARAAMGGAAAEELRLYVEREASDHVWPLPMAWAVSVRLPRGEVNIGTIAFPAAGPAATTISVRLQNGLWASPPDRVDVVLRPVADAAERTVEITEFAGGELEFKDVPLIQLAPEGRPASARMSRVRGVPPPPAGERRR